MPLPRSLTNLKRVISEKKWVEACHWAGGRTPRRNTRCRKARGRVLPDQDGALPDRAVPQLDEESAHPAMRVVPVPEPDSGAPLQGVP